MTNVQHNIQTSLDLSDVYSDSRTHGHQGPTRNVRLYRATSSGSGAISKSEDGLKCAVTGKESLRIIHVSDGSGSQSTGHKSSVGQGGYRIDASRNFWDGSGLKIDSTSTDVAWGHGVFNNKILTSARNGELIMWDLNKSGTSKYERRSKDHVRSIHAMSVSHIIHHYCITGSADGDMRVWDLRDLTRSLMRIRNPTSVRSVMFSPSTWQPLHAVVGLDNGSINRWDLKMGQRGLLDRLPIAHTASVTTLDWCNVSATEGPGNGLGWLVSGGLDRCVKVWDLTAPGVNTHIPSKPTYVLHPSFPVRRVAWRPSFECELAVVSNLEFAMGLNPDLAQTEPNKHGKVDNTSISTSVGGDAVEIWDVRREWIPKWSVAGSATEGGITDLTFGDSNALWTHHFSGMFSQIDLRNCTKPLDAITRTAMSWEASGSLAFIVGKRNKWEIPFDDISPERRRTAEKHHIKFKTLGDKRSVPSYQDMGIMISDETVHEFEVFNQIARGYVIEGNNRTTICNQNARVAFQAGKYEVAQTWLLLGASLDECMPCIPPIPPSFETKKPLLSQSASAPAAVPSTFSSSGPLQARKSSPGRGSNTELRISRRSASTSASQKMTPASSNSSSPHQVPGPLPPITPRRPSFFSGRDVIDSELARRTSISLYRRPSVSAPSTQSTSPGEKPGGGGSLRHVGEGALDDSDSSSSGSEDADNCDGDGSSDEEGNSRPPISPSHPFARNMPTPSPLSRVAGQQRWTEDEGETKDNDEDEASSPSPRSTDTESIGSNSPPRRPKSNSKSSKRYSARIKSRSRSSTVASLAALPTRRLTHQDSSNSIRTITAGEVSFRDHEGETHGIKIEETVRDLRSMHDRRKSQTMSEFIPDPSIVEQVGKDEEITTDRRIEMIRSDETRFRELAWSALREALEYFADAGDIQTCATLAAIAPEELCLSGRRVNRFLDGYIEILTRRQLHAHSAYMRKYCQVEDTHGMTLLTTIHTACGKCKRALVVPAGSPIPGQMVKGGFSYCKSCRMSFVTCAICRLPVRGLLFQCSICSHGGHQTCYQNYFEQRQMVDLPSSLFFTAPQNNSHSLANSTEDNSTLNALDSSTENSPIRIHPNRLAGYPCATGCGHFCWATNNNEDET